MNKFVQILRKALTKIGIHEANKLVWGYGYKKSEVDKEIVEYYHAAKLLRDQELVGYNCLSKKEKENIISGIGRVAGVQCSESDHDYTKESRPDKDEFIKSNPDCVAYEYYADYIQAQCKKVGIDFKIIKKECEKVGIDLDVRKHEVCEAIELALEVKEHRCDVDIDLNVNMQRCIIDFETIVVPQKCDIDFKTFVHKISCGATVETIVESLNCGASVDVDVEESDNDCDIPTPCSVTITCPTLPDCATYVDCICDNTCFPNTSYRCGEVCGDGPILGYLLQGATITGCLDCGVDINIASESWGEPLDLGGGEFQFQISNTCLGICQGECSIAADQCQINCEGDPECEAACSNTLDSCNEACASLPEGSYEATLTFNTSSQIVVETCDVSGVIIYSYEALLQDSLGNIVECTIYRTDILC